jgi:hypothetical protein
MTVTFSSFVTFVELAESAVAGGAVICPSAACPAIPMAMIEAAIFKMNWFFCPSIKFFVLMFVQCLLLKVSTKRPFTPAGQDAGQNLGTSISREELKSGKKTGESPNAVQITKEGN